MAEVFISYESSNQKQADDLVAALEEKRYNCWIATRDVPKGDPYDDHIPEAIAQCRIVVMLFSRASLNSPHVKKELRIAVKHDKKIIPFMLEEIQLREAFEYHIESNNRISADKDWNKAVEELLHSMGNTDIETAKVNQQEKVKKQIPADPHSDYIRCPRCGATSLKQKRYYVDEYFQYRTSKTPKEDLFLWFRKNRSKFEPTFAVIAMLLVMAAMGCLLFAPAEEQIESSFVAAVLAGSAIMLGLYVMLYFALNSSCDNIEDDLIETIHNSNMKYWTFHCGVCESDFSILVPKDDTPEQRVEHLLNKKSKKQTYKQMRKEHKL